MIATAKCSQEHRDPTLIGPRPFILVFDIPADLLLSINGLTYSKYMWWPGSQWFALIWLYTATVVQCRNLKVWVDCYQNVCNICLKYTKIFFIRRKTEVSNFYTPRLWHDGCNSFDIFCVCVCLSVRPSCYPSQTDRHTDLNFGMEVKWKYI